MIQDCTAFFDFSDPHDPQGARLRGYFSGARQCWSAHSLDALRPTIEAAAAAAQAGAWVLGWLTYEAAGGFDSALRTHGPVGHEPHQPHQSHQPLAFFAAFDGPQAVAPAQAEDADAQKNKTSAAHVDWGGLPSRADFDSALAQISEAIARGDCYQVNYTAPWWGRLQGSAAALFAALQRAQPGGYAAWIQAGSQQVMSLSPELFFDWRADAQGIGPILTRPMKGTAGRAADPQEDAAQAQRLRASTKECAENVMIVDLLRNDLSRIAQPHSVQVDRLLDVQALPTVWQMTSDVRATTRPGTRLWDVFSALFPCGSVTGAPKVQAMRTIAALENHPRGVYCGALGLLRPDGAGGLAATFNVPIRTLQIQGDTVRLDVGSGIVWGAKPEDEWREWAAKRVFCERASAPFDLLETLALCHGQYRHLHAHLARLQDAARHFAYPWDAALLHAALQDLARRHGQGVWRVRLLLTAEGQFQTQALAYSPVTEPVVLQLAPQPFIQAHSEFVRYKTTRRAHYAAFAPEPGSGVFDTLLFNEAQEITETTFGNVAALIDGRWLTPALDCGLLPGVGRAQALEQGRVREGRIRLDDLPRVQSWAFINSLRGWLDARLLPPAA